jgi:DNA-binding NarL/FixJ family response regulator
MRVALVGAAAERDWLRARLDASIDVVAEFATLSAARRAGLDFDAILVSPDRLRRGHFDGARGESGDVDDEGVPLYDPLTTREIQVLELLAEGLSNKAIGARLGISDQTVKFHVASLAGKLGAVNRTDAVRRAVRRGLIAL